ncbi:MAG: hypothetical protein JSV90_05040 [Methanobacteriota archaeon]|nr:MAG: hypothetical protein JSV90_05040 [Euryarchaeota archaeon]
MRCLSKPISVFIVAVTLLSCFSFLASIVSDEPALERDPELPASSEAIIEPTFIVSPTSAYVGEVITFNASAESDIIGTNLTFTIYYDYFLSDGSTPNPDSPTSVNVTGNPGRAVTEYIYSQPGPVSNNYYVRVYIDDGEAVRYITKRITIRNNSAPYFAPDLGSALSAELDNETFTASLNMSVVCWDKDDDNLTLIWDFGDGTEPVVQWTGPAVAGVECVQNHTWSPDPEMWYGIGDTDIIYYVNLSLTDHLGHWKNESTPVLIGLDHNFSPKGNISVLASVVDPTDVVTIYGNASDREGEPLTWTFVFSNETEVIRVDVFHTGLTDPGERVFQNTSCVFSVTGNYTVALHLSDLALPEMQNDPDFSAHNVSVGQIYVSSVNNSLPYLSRISVKDCYTGKEDVVLNATTGIALVRFSVQAADLDGEIVYATWDFGDGSEAAYNVSVGGTDLDRFVQIHEYPVAGQFNVSIVITDGRPGHEVMKYKLLNVTSLNLAPEVRSLRVVLSNSSYGLPGSVVRFELVLFDNERDPLEVRWDFGDGSPVEYTNATAFDEDGRVSIVVSHIYSEVGTYRAWVNFTDGLYGLTGYHEDSYCSVVLIDVPDPVIVREWDWWDYASLTLFFVIIVMLVLWAVMGSLKRRRIDMLGVTAEEYLLRKKEVEEFDKRHMREEGSG